MATKLKIPCDTVRRMLRLVGMVTILIAGLSDLATAQPSQDLYSAQTIVTGTGEPNRVIGFRACLDQVIVKVSGDQRLLADPKMTKLRDQAGDFIDSFRYRDRLEGIPVHDEQGTHDRPHDLTCLYKPTTIDAVLAELGRRPWLDERPNLAIILNVTDQNRSFQLTADGTESPYMAESLEAAATPMALAVTLPETRQLSDLQKGTLKVDEIVRELGADLALTGKLIWSRKDLGWVAEWQLAFHGQTYEWQERGVSFDEAFRLAIRGAARILSGNGRP